MEKTRYTVTAHIVDNVTTKTADIVMDGTDPEKMGTSIGKLITSTCSLINMSKEDLDHVAKNVKTMYNAQKYKQHGLTLETIFVDNGYPGHGEWVMVKRTPRQSKFWQSALGYRKRELMNFGEPKPTDAEFAKAAEEYIQRESAEK